MKRSQITTVVLAAAAALITAAGVMLCISLYLHSAEPDRDGWSMLLMLPAPAAAAVAVTLLLLDILCIVMAVTLTVSYVRLSRAVSSCDDKTAGKPRFSRLTALDAEVGVPDGTPYNERIDLRGFCDGFRSYAASGMGLYYDEKVIRSFVSALSCTHLIIIQGISGTGKTSLPFAFGKYVCRDAAVTPVQPSWKDRSDLLGYYNEFTDSYTETELLCRLYEANMSDDVFTVVLDEMNIARVEYYFAEFLSLLELPEGTSRRVRVTADSRQSDPALFSGGTLQRPSNVWFVGTANNDDSTLSISDKVRDRSFVLELNSRSRPFAASDTGRTRISSKRLKELFGEARTAHPMSSEIRSAISETDEYLGRRLGITFGNRLIKQAESFIPAYVACGGTEEEAADMLICRKLAAKTEELNPVTCINEAAGLIKQLNGAFGDGAMSECIAYLKKYGEEG